MYNEEQEKQCINCKYFTKLYRRGGYKGFYDSGYGYCKNPALRKYNVCTSGGLCKIWEQAEDITAEEQLNVTIDNVLYFVNELVSSVKK